MQRLWQASVYTFCFTQWSTANIQIIFDHAEFEASDYFGEGALHAMVKILDSFQSVSFMFLLAFK